MKNSEIAKFINSDDERFFLEEINYQFTADQAAWLISRCRSLTLEERHRAWNDVINTMPDCQLQSVHFDLHGKKLMLHDTLKKIICTENRLLESFYSQNENAVFEYIFRGDRFDDRPYMDMVFSDYTSCREAAGENLDKFAEDEDMISSVVIRKKYFSSETREYIELTATSSLDVLDYNIEIGFGERKQEDEEAVDLLYVFDNLWFCFPCPFKKGDIVWCRNPRNGRVDGPIVLEGTTPIRCAEHPKFRGADSSDMIVCGYCQHPDGTLYYECNDNYMDYEYCPPEKLTGNKRILTALSNYLKDEISVDLFANAYLKIMLEDLADDKGSQHLGLYTDESLKLAGLEPPKKDPDFRIL
jgi:hypothetical protein